MSPFFRRRAPAAPDAEIRPEQPPDLAPSTTAAPAEADASIERAAPGEVDGVAPRRPHAGLLRRERRALLRARATRVIDLGGLLLEMYRRGAFRDDLLAEHCADVVGIDARLAEIDTLLHTRGNAPRCECGAPVLLGSHFCPNCGRPLAPAAANGSATSEATVVEPPEGSR